MHSLSQTPSQGTKLTCCLETSHIDRSQCDERSEGCLRCERYGIACPGYEHPFDVVLRRKGIWEPASHNLQQPHSEIRNTNSESHYDEQHSERALVEQETATVTYPSVLTHQPSVDQEEAALGAYYATYCVTSSTLCSLEHIRKQGNGCLLAAIKMLGTMQLHQIWQLPGGSAALVRQYTEATTLLNRALASSTESQEDSTLLATLLLSVVEMKKSPDFTLHYWLVHTRGAAALMELRGVNQILTRLGSALFLQISSQIVVYCILGRRHIPAELRRLRQEVQRYVIDENHPLWQWHGLLYRFVDFFAAASAPRPEQTTRDAQAIIAEALSIREEIEYVFQSVRKYDIQASDEFGPLIAYEHVYHSLLTARVWNERRTAEILLFTTIVRVVDSGNDQAQLDRDSSLYLSDAYEGIRYAALEILAGVPQMLSGLKGKSHFLASSGSTQGIQLCDSSSEYHENIFQQTRQNHTVLPYMDPCRVQWPIYFAVQCEYVEPQIRSHLLRVLEDAGKIMQIQQWQILAESLRSTAPDLN